MHRCLCVPEILSLICAEFSSDCPYSLPTRDGNALASLARTSKSWSEPALEVLWRSIDGIEKLFPELQSLLHEDEPEMLSLQRCLTAAEMNVFKKNAARIRDFEESDGKYNALYPVLFGYGYGSSLLPNLRRLNWQVSTPEAFPYFRLLLCPNLKELRLCIQEEIVFEQLNSLKTLSIPSSSPTVGPLPKISQLELCLNDIPISQFPSALSARKELLNVLHSWSQLTDLDIDEMPLESLGCIVSLPNLKRLKFVGELDPPLHLYPLPIPFRPQAMPPSLEPPCPLLEDLSIYQVPLSIIDNMFKVLIRVHLKNLAFAFGTDHYDPDEDIMPLLNNLDRHIDPYTLESITLSCCFNVEFPTFIVPLLKFHRLREVSLDAAPFESIPEMPMSQVATSWPLIEALRIRSSQAEQQGWDWESPPSQDAASSFTLISLIPLAKECRNLRLLSLTVAADSETQDVIERNPHMIEGVENSSLRGLLLSEESLIADNEEFVAAFLSSLFPALDNVTHDVFGWSDEEPSSDILGWRRVGELLRTQNREKRSERFDAQNDKPYSRPR
ncbi:hypothetical protein NP233_g3091 [Leucocoprinus birnbaumii]|uniref:F-box domain-containing protein n=1 Tax=Leucocoprinus birnbaumii TaxID=56174 RepID=A0AAD5YU94_9AGAR|nr:hypothetical protein NP233_g3091 [Leucocoprinus birnbaumii]